MILDVIDFSGLLQGFIDIVFNFIFKLTDILLYPLNLLIQTFLPDSMSTISTFVTSCFSQLSNVSKYVMSFTGFYSLTIDIIIVLIVSIFTLPLAVHGVKTAIRWFRAFKL